MRTNLDGPYRLTYDAICAALPEATPGVFALGYNGRGDVFYINYVGRSDSDVRKSLLDLIGSDLAFKYGLSSSAEEAFIRECELFHALRPPGNRVHPVRAASTNWACPSCSRSGRWR